MPLGFSTLGSTALGASAFIAQRPPVVVPQPTVIGVTLLPANAVIDGPTQQFTWNVAGANNPPQTVDLITTLGTIDATGLLTRPAKTSAEQSGTVTASSTLDPNVKGMASFTIPALAVVDQPPAVRTVSLQLGEADGPAANLKNLMVSFHAAPGPHATGLALYQSALGTTDASGRLSFEVDGEAIGIGEAGLLAVLAADGRHYLGLVAVA